MSRSVIVGVFLLAVLGCSSDPSTADRDKGGPRKEPPPPCHPGCFPAGTLIATPDGPQPIETIRQDQLVVLIDDNGTQKQGRVRSTFQTTNRLVEVRTESGNLLTTETQPLCLVEGGHRRAGELAAGDRIWRWLGDERLAVTIQTVQPTGPEAPVFNLVVGESAVFVAAGFLARGKPPATDNNP